MSGIDLSHIRRAYDRPELLEERVSKDPIAQLRAWIQEAYDAGSAEPNAMCVCTVSSGGPSARMVLLRGLDDRGLAFFTSYFSRKGRELAENPRIAAVFYWPELARQVRVEGAAEQLPEDESDAYFASRPRGHQLGAWASEQSETVESRAVLDQRLQDFDGRFEGEQVPRPHSWGGFLIRPDRFEFWQGRANRMHDRLEFERAGGSWQVRRLQP
jgi:pyridoxamine 5'-phosphate oxidase